MRTGKSVRARASRPCDPCSLLGGDRLVEREQLREHVLLGVEAVQDGDGRIELLLEAPQRITTWIAEGAVEVAERHPVVKASSLQVDYPRSAIGHRADGIGGRRLRPRSISTR